MVLLTIFFGGLHMKMKLRSFRSLVPYFFPPNYSSDARVQYFPASVNIFFCTAGLFCGVSFAVNMADADESRQEDQIQEEKIKEEQIR